MKTCKILDIVCNNFSYFNILNDLNMLQKGILQQSLKLLLFIN